MQRLFHYGIFLPLMCANAAGAPAGKTSKADKQAHGFGLELVREIAERYGREAEIGRAEGRFSITVRLGAKMIA